MFLGAAFKKGGKKNRGRRGVANSIFFRWGKHVHVLLFPERLPRHSMKTTWKKWSEETDEAAREWKCESWSFQYWSWCWFQPCWVEPASAGGSTCLRLFGRHGDGIFQSARHLHCHSWPGGREEAFSYFTHQRPGGPTWFFRNLERFLFVCFFSWRTTSRAPSVHILSLWTLWLNKKLWRLQRFGVEWDESSSTPSNTWWHVSSFSLMKHCYY